MKPGAYDHLEPEERPVAAAAAVALQEARVRLTDKRLFLIFMLIVALGVGGGWWIKRADANGKKALHREQLADEAGQRKNCESLNRTIRKIDLYIDAQYATIEARTDLPAPTKAQLLSNLALFRPELQDCS